MGFGLRVRLLSRLTLSAVPIIALTLWLLPESAAAQESFLVTADDVSFGVYDLATYNLQKTISTGFFGHMVVTGVNPRLAFILGETGYLQVVDLTIGREIKKIVNVWGSGAAVSADGKTLYTFDDLNGTLDIIDVASLSVTRRVNLTPMGANATTGGGAVVLVGDKAFLTPEFLDTRHPAAGVVDLSTLKVTTIPIPNGVFNGWTGNAVATQDGKYVAMIEDVGATPELLLIDTSTYAVTSQTLTVDPYAIVVNPNKVDPTKFFGYLIGYNDQGTVVAAAVDFRPGSQTYGQILTATEVQLTNLSYGSSASALGISSDGKKLIVPGDGQLQFGPNLMVVDTGLMFTDPAHAIVNSQTIAGGNNALGVAVGTVTLIPPNSAPTVTGVQGNVTNDKETEITVSGTNFLSGALVRIGGTPPLNATVDNGSSLRVTVPVNAPADPALDIIVTNPQSNSPLDQQYQSGLLAGQLKISLNPLFQPQEQFASLNPIGTGTVRMFDLKQRDIVTLTASPSRSLTALAFNVDGAELFGANTVVVSAWDTSTGQMVGGQLRVNGTLAFRQPITASRSPLTQKPVIYAAASKNTSPRDILLNIIDAERNSPTFNTVIETIPAGLQLPSLGSLSSQVATPDGKYVYVPYSHSDSGGSTHIAIFDVVNESATIFNTDRFKVFSGQFQPIITQDGKWLILRGSPSIPSVTTAVQLKVFDIGTNPKNPRFMGNITPPRTRGGVNSAPDMLSYAIGGNHLFALNRFATNLMIFNFKPQNNDFRPVTIYKLPGTTAYVFAPLALSPDGNYIYVALEADSMVAVLDANKLLQIKDPLVTTIADSDSTRYLTVSPVPPPAKPQLGKERQQPLRPPRGRLSRDRMRPVLE